MNIALIGCGWLGTRLMPILKNQHTLFLTTTTEEKKQQFEKDGLETLLLDLDQENITQRLADFSQHIDRAIIMVPFSKRHNIEKVALRVQNLCDFLGEYSSPLFMSSSTGIYPDIEATITEVTCPLEELNPEILLAETILQKKYPQLTILRFGGLLGDQRQIGNYRIEPTEQKVNHIHHTDACGLFNALIDKPITSELFNAVAPLHPTKRVIIAHQKPEKQLPKTDQQPFGKVINADKIQQALNYTFKKPDPLYFAEN